MKIKIHSLHFDADKKLLSFIEEKVQKLTLFFDGIIDSEVILRIDKSSEADNKLVEIKLMIPGNDLFARKQCRTFEEAVDLCCEALRKQVSKHKEKVKGM
jgi:putative sigma-54 modulation protein